MARRRNTEMPWPDDMISQLSDVPRAPYYVFGEDTFMSGWGGSEGLRNVLIFPAVSAEEADVIARNMMDRSEFKGVRIGDRAMVRKVISEPRILAQLKERRGVSSRWYTKNGFRGNPRRRKKRRKNPQGIPEGMVAIRLGSHRAREYFMRSIGRRAQGYYSFHDKNHVYAVTPEEWADFVDAKKNRRTYWHGSVTKARLVKGADYSETGGFWGGSEMRESWLNNPRRKRRR